MTISLKIDLKDFNQRLQVNKKITDTVIQNAYDKFRSITPIKTGNARSHTTLDKNNHTIWADYPYAGPLDNGWSKQAPAGMTTPTITFIEKMVEQEIRKQNGI